MLKKIIFIFLVLIFLEEIALSSYYVKAQGFSTSTVSATIEISVCGDGIVEGQESCDGINLNGQDCKSLGFLSGTLTCDSACSFDTSNCIAAFPSEGGPVWTKSPVKTKVILSGIAYPGSIIDILLDGKKIAETTADSSANFEIEITSLTSGVNNFGIKAEDKIGRDSIVFSFAATIIADKTTNISGLFVPPTIEIKDNTLSEGENLEILGSSSPLSEIYVYIEKESVEIENHAQAENNGEWEYSFDTSGMEKGIYFVKVKATSQEGFISTFSNFLEFGIGEIVIIEEKYSKSDFNKDEKVDLVDFSILLYWWNKYNPYVDQNNDKKIDLQDFSIMMYYWTG